MKTRRHTHDGTPVTCAMPPQTPPSQRSLRLRRNWWSALAGGLVRAGWHAVEDACLGAREFLVREDAALVEVGQLAEFVAV